MFVIAHRGNLFGPKTVENNPFKIQYLLSCRLYGRLTIEEFEIDVWLIGNKWFLGHDAPRYEVSLSFLIQPHLWLHAKNLEALEFLTNFKEKSRINYFWHENDQFTLTSTGYIWTYPLQRVCKKSIIVCRSKAETRIYSQLNIAGVCTDYPYKI